MPERRQFNVYARELGAHHGRLLEEGSFEAAAVAFLEDLHGASEGDISILVRDVETGCSHCFHVDLTTGETTACG